MKKQWILLAAVIFGAGLVLATSQVLAAGQEGSWTGVITDTHCGYKANHTAACVNTCVMDKGAKYALANPESGKVYILLPQDKAAPLANEKVKVTGTLEGDTIQVKTIDKVGK